MTNEEILKLTPAIVRSQYLLNLNEEPEEDLDELQGRVKKKETFKQATIRRWRSLGFSDAEIRARWKALKAKTTTTNDSIPNLPHFDTDEIRKVSEKISR